MQSSDKLTVRRKMLFSTGDLATSLPLAILMFYQFIFLTDVAGLRPDIAGWAVGLGKLWDAVNDPLFGLISDRLRTRWGRRRGVLLFGAVPLGLSFMLMWLVPPLDQLGLAVYYTLTFIVFDSVFTFIHVSYNSLTPEMTPDYDERSSLNGYRMIFNIVGTLGAIIFAIVLGWYVTDKRVFYTILAVGLGLATIVPPLIVFKVTQEKPAEEQPQPLPVGEAIRATLSNRPFWMVMGLYLLSWTTASVLAAVLVYFVQYYLLVPDQANYFVLTFESSAILFIPLWVWVAQKTDKRRAFIWGSLSWIVVLAALMFVGPGQIVLVYGLAALGGSGLATAFVIPWSMVPDIIEYDQLKTGQRREGAYYSFASLFQKGATGIAMVLMGQMLAWAGYITPTLGGALPVQPAAAITAIRWFVGPIPIVLLLLGIVFAWRYPITRESHRAMRDEIARTLLDN
jgi:glycoside/pentoside/hexuronide:cation symporter, GPH family